MQHCLSGETKKSECYSPTGGTINSAIINHQLLHNHYKWWVRALVGNLKGFLESHLSHKKKKSVPHITNITRRHGKLYFNSEYVEGVGVEGQEIGGKEEEWEN